MFQCLTTAAQSVKGGLWLLLELSPRGFSEIFTPSFIQELSTGVVCILLKVFSLSTNQLPNKLLIQVNLTYGFTG